MYLFDKNRKKMEKNAAQQKACGIPYLEPEAGWKKYFTMWLQKEKNPSNKIGSRGAPNPRISCKLMNRGTVP